MEERPEACLLLRRDGQELKVSRVVSTAVWLRPGSNQTASDWRGVLGLRPSALLPAVILGPARTIS